MKMDGGKKKRIWIAVCVVVAVMSGLCVFYFEKEKEVVPEYVFSYAENQTKDYPTTLGGLKFAQLVEERTQGRIQIRVQPEGVLGSETEVIRQMQYGGIDFARISICLLYTSPSPRD